MSVRGAAWIVEGHGDLRPEHVCLTEPIVIFDCLEFNEELRSIDPFDELAFLGMECALLGEPAVGRHLMDRVGERLGPDSAGSSRAALHGVPRSAAGPPLRCPSARSRAAGPCEMAARLRPSTFGSPKKRWPGNSRRAGQREVPGHALGDPGANLALVVGETAADGDRIGLGRIEAPQAGRQLALGTRGIGPDVGKRCRSVPDAPSLRHDRRKERRPGQRLVPAGNRVADGRAVFVPLGKSASGPAESACRSRASSVPFQPDSVSL